VLPGLTGNAVLLASGLASGGRQEAQHRLEQFWRQASEAAPRVKIGKAAMAATRVVSPYQFNPFNLNSLRSILTELIDFETLQSRYVLAAVFTDGGGASV
jgi:NTE family protein